MPEVASTKECDNAATASDFIVSNAVVLTPLSKILNDVRSAMDIIRRKTNVTELDNYLVDLKLVTSAEH